MNYQRCRPPQANYVNAVTTGNLVFLAGKGPKKADGTYIKGKVGADLTQEEGYEAAKIVAINQLAALKAENWRFEQSKTFGESVRYGECCSRFYQPTRSD